MLCYIFVFSLASENHIFVVLVPIVGGVLLFSQIRPVPINVTDKDSTIMITAIGEMFVIKLLCR